MSKGFTLIETLLSIGLLFLIIGTPVAISANWYSLNNFDTAYSITLSTLRKAQAYAIDGKNNGPWGVCLIGSTLRLFSGSCASPTQSNDYIYPANVTLSGFTSVSFSNFRGEPSSPQNITINSSDKTKTIQINSLGGFDVN